MTEILQATETVDVRRPESQIAASIARTFPDHIPLYACAALFTAVTLIISFIYDTQLPWGAAAFFLGALAVFAVFALPLFALWQLFRLWRASAVHPAVALLSQFADTFCTGNRAGYIFHSLIIFVPLMICFAAVKDVIPFIHPFSWDTSLMRWDQATFLGHHPWEVLQPILGFPLATASLNFLYDLWLPVMFGCLFWQAFFGANDGLRLQFLLAFSFAWFIAGNLLAVVFSSAGPCFYGFLHPGQPNPYAAQMEYLQMADSHWRIWSLDVQNALWASYSKSAFGAVSGISAMPSMHVTSAVLMALVGWRTSRKLGLALGAFAFAIVIGSIHLAWHYAADGIAGIALALLFWWLAGHIARRWMARTTPQ